MEPLAPIVDQMREIAIEELPSPRSCRVMMWDDGTFDTLIYHSGADDEAECIRYERTTSEILWERNKGARGRREEFSNGESLRTPTYDEAEVRVITTIEPPY